MKILITGGSGFIGTNLIELLEEKNVEILNIDIKKPPNLSQIKYWRNVDILDKDKLVHEFELYNPTHIVHLAARTDTVSNILVDYIANTTGTENVLHAIMKSIGIQRVIITSTQFVCKPGKLPENDLDFDPHTTYGQSKVVTELLTREAGLKCCWTIIRPTNVWGAWHSRYPYEFWKVLKGGYYFHPRGPSVSRSYAYVGNVVHQISRIFEVPPEVIAGKVFYVGDRPIELIDWVNGFSIAITGKKARRIPGQFIRAIGYFGDLLSFVKVKFPITSSRYTSMTQDYTTPMERTFMALGEPPYSMEHGINLTVKWLNNDYRWGKSN